MQDSNPIKNWDILLVEDDLPTQIFVRQILVKQGFQVLVAGNGQEAIAQIINHRVDFIITDLQMDGMDGHGLLDYMADHYPLIPIIVLTGTAAMMTMLDCLREGALAFCTKPLGDGSDLIEATRIAVELVTHRKQQLHNLCSAKRNQRDLND